jgi:DNA-binding transcriptional LysR family regulator
MNFTFHQLRVFLEVVKQKNVTKAAATMHMTQPALSIQLKNFQQQFDMPLTEIINKRLYVTEFGYEISELAKNVLNEADAIELKTKEYKGLLRGKLKISSASTGKYVIPYFLNGFLKANSGIDLLLYVTNKTSTIKSLQKNEIDFALVSIIPDNMSIKEEPLIDNKLYLVGSTKNFDADKPLIYREPGSATRIVMENYFDKNKKRKSIELTSTEAVKQAVMAGIGYSILPLVGIKNELLKKQLFIINSKGLPVTTKWRLIWLEDKKLSPVAKTYLDYLSVNKDQIIRKNFSWYLNFSSAN